MGADSHRHTPKSCRKPSQENEGFYRNQKGGEGFWEMGQVGQVHIAAHGFCSGCLTSSYCCDGQMFTYLWPYMCGLADSTGQCLHFLIKMNSLLLDTTYTLLTPVLNMICDY